MDFHSRLSPPEDSTKSPRAQKRARNVNNHVQNWFSFWSEPSVYFWAAAKPLSLIMRAVILLAHSWPREHPPSCLRFLLRMQSQRSTRTPLRALLLADTAQVEIRSQPNFTSRGVKKDTFLLKHSSCSSQQCSLCETKLRCVLRVRVQPACRLAVALVALSGRMEAATPSPILKGCCPTHWVLKPRQVKSCRSSVNTQSKGQISAKMKCSQEHLFHLDVLVEIWWGTDAFAADGNNESILRLPLCFTASSSPEQSMDFQALSWPKSPSAEPPQKSKGRFQREIVDLHL